MRHSPLVLTPVWKAIARSVTGVGHLRQSMPCQDYSRYHQLKGGVLIGAVADGAGSAQYSQRGAQLVVESSLAYLQRWENFGYRRRLKLLPWLMAIAEPKRRAFFEKLLRFLRRQLRELSQLEGISLDSLASTLLVFVASREGIVAMQVGDGFLVVRSTPDHYQLLFQPDKGEYFNETTFVTSSQASQALQTCCYPQPVQFICAATDGLEKVAIKFQDWSAFAPFFQPLEAFLRETQDPEANPDYLEQFLHSERLNQRTQDDKTLLLALAPPPPKPLPRRSAPQRSTPKSLAPKKHHAPDQVLLTEDSLTGKSGRDIWAGGLGEQGKSGGESAPWLL